MPPTNETFKQHRVFLRFNKLTNMNVSLFGVADRSAEQEFISEVDSSIRFDFSYHAEKGIMVVAYPSEDQETELEFEYWSQLV